MKTTKLSLALILLTSALCLVFGTSCGNTVRGAGRDIERAGDEIQDAAR